MLARDYGSHNADLRERPTCYAVGMGDEPRSAEAVFIDQRGVDRSQIRELLALKPIDRLRHMQSVLEGLLRIRRLIDDRTPR